MNKILVRDTIEEIIEIEEKIAKVLNEEIYGTPLHNNINGKYGLLIKDLYKDGIIYVIGQQEYESLPDLIKQEWFDQRP